MEGAYGDGVPDLVKRFVVYFYRHIRERNIREIQSMYEVSFAKLTDRFFKSSSWPPASLVAGLVDGDHVFCLLYQEMYFRHLYAVTQPSLQQRVESWQNYQALFNVILRGNVNMQLPNVWLWDMVDEFIYQFQSFAQYRGRLHEKSAEEVALLRKACASGFWDIAQVLTYLQTLAEKSGIAQDLSTSSSEQRLAQTDGYEPQRSNVLRMLGYYSLLGLLRVHCLVGDYHGALKALAPLNPFKRKNLLTPRIAGANITLYYYAGFAYLMQQRYLDAATCFNTILGYISRVKQQYQRSSQYDQILKKNEQLYSLLALTLALCPAAQRCVDEVIINTLREKHGDKMHRMVQRGDGLHDELFGYACPKFVTAAPPKLDGSHIGVNTNQEAYRLQLRCFLGQVATQSALPGLKQTLKLYTSISLPKLAALMEQDQAAVRSQLMTLKASSSCKTWSGQGDAAEGTMQPAIDVDFFIDTDPESSVEMVTISDVKPVRRHGEFLARHISKFEDIIRDLNAPAPAAAGASPAARAPSGPSAVAAY